MPTCNDCIHQELCNIYANAGVTDVPADDITICEVFKNKADVVEVIRCKNCKCYEHERSSNQHFCNRYGGYVDENDYCSRCERRSDNG